MSLVDTHCHIHEPDYSLDIDQVLARSRYAGVNEIICVGTSEDSSRQAVEFAPKHKGVYAAIGVHPHEVKDGFKAIKDLVVGESITDNKIVAVGEIGLDYFYENSPRDMQIKALEWQIDFALKHNLPIIFHVREAFDDFWPIFDNFHGISGVVHSFTDSSMNAEKAIARNLFIGVNGISTFTKDAKQQDMYKSIPLSNLLFETDAPFLTPTPFRGKVNEPAFVRNVAEFHVANRDLDFDEVARITTANARALFAL